MMLSAALILILQVAAVLPEEPETWVLEYPRIIQDDVDAYYGCLRSRGVTTPPIDLAVFEEQHRAHVPMCAKQLKKSVEMANATLAGRERYAEYTPERIAATFKTIEYVHIARGRDIDNRLRLTMTEAETYERATANARKEFAGKDRIEANLPASSSQETPNAQN